MINIIPEQLKEIPWGWETQTDVNGIKFTTSHPGTVKMPYIIDYFNWNRWHVQPGIPTDVALNGYCTKNMKSILTTYARFVGFENAIVEMNAGDLDRITQRFIAWNLELIKKSPRRVNYFVIGDDLASQRAPFVSPDSIEEKYIPFLRNLIQVANGNVENVVFHSCGDIYRLLDLLVSLKIDMIHFQRVGNMRKFNSGDMIYNQQIGGYTVLIENVDPYATTKAEGIIH